MSKYRAPIIKLDESESSLPTEIQLLRIGTFHHPQYGKFEITKEHLAAMVTNFDEKVRGIDLAIDFSHKNEEEAAGWIVQPQLRNDGTELWSEVRWTDEGHKKISSKAFRYTSAEFSLNYRDNETLTEHGPTLLGVGLTNRPAVKNMEPIVQLSEYDSKKEHQMDEKDKQIEMLKAKIAELEGKLAKQLEDDKEMGEMKKELEEDKKELSEKLTNLEKENNELKTEKAKIEKEKQFDVMLNEGKVVEAQREAFMGNDFAKFTENAQPVKLVTDGNSGEQSKSKKSAQDQLFELAEARAKKEGEDFDVALDFVLSENKELRKKYNEETRI